MLNRLSVSTSSRRCGFLTALLLQQGLQRGAGSLWRNRNSAPLARTPTKSELVDFSRSRQHQAVAISQGDHCRQIGLEAAGETAKPASRTEPCRQPLFQGGVDGAAAADQCVTLRPAMALSIDGGLGPPPVVAMGA